MENNKIEQVIEALFRIESSAEGIKADTEQQKAEYTQEIEKKVKLFDENLENEHKENLAKLTERLEREKIEAMDSMRKAMEAEVEKLDEAYNKNHEKIAKEIFEQLISE